jgi:hypothetical protein
LVELAERHADAPIPADDFEEESIRARAHFDLDWTGFIEGGDVRWGDEGCNRDSMVRWAGRDLACYATTPDPWEAAEKVMACVRALIIRRAAKTSANKRKLAECQFEHVGDYEDALVALVPSGVTVAEHRELCAWFLDPFGNPFQRTPADPNWLNSTVVGLARQMYESREFSAMPILADALQDAGCDNRDILDHCRDPKQTHVRGCWVVDVVLGKE